MRAHADADDAELGDAVALDDLSGSDLLDGWIEDVAELVSSSRFMVKEMSVVPLTETFCTMTSMMTLASAKAVKIREAIPGRSGTLVIVTFAWLRSTETPRTTTFSNPGVSSLTIVPLWVLKLLRTSKGTLNFLANSTERDCITFEPEAAISRSSSCVITSIFLALGTMRGSHE